MRKLLDITEAKRIIPAMLVDFATNGLNAISKPNDNYPPFDIHHLGFNLFTSYKAFYNWANGTYIDLGLTYYDSIKQKFDSSEDSFAIFEMSVPFLYKIDTPTTIYTFGQITYPAQELQTQFGKAICNFGLDNTNVLFDYYTFKDRSPDNKTSSLYVLISISF